MVKTYDILVIGFGKAGKTLAAKMSQLGKKVALVEQDSKMYGGTCINIGCIPTMPKHALSQTKSLKSQLVVTLSSLPLKPLSSTQVHSPMSFLFQGFWRLKMSLTAQVFKILINSQLA